MSAALTACGLKRSRSSPAIRTKAQYGVSIDLDGDLAAVGAEQAAGAAPYAGAAYVLHRGADGLWSETGKLYADDGANDDFFGHAVGLAGNTAVVGAYYSDAYGAESGSAYVFSVSDDADGNGVMDACQCAADLNYDRQVDLADLGILLVEFGCTAPPGTPPCGADLNGDRNCDLADLSLLLTNFGSACE